MDKSLQATLFSEIHHCANLLHRSRHLIKQTDTSRPPMPPGQGRLLATLLRQDGMAQKEIVELLDIRPSSVGELVSKLEAQGLVQRRENDADKRVMHVFLTEEGRTLATQTVNARQAMLTQQFEGLSEEEQQQLSDLLVKLAASLKEKYGDAPRHGHHGHGHHKTHGPHHHGPGHEDF